MKEIILRQSWINNFLRCPEQARQERLELVSQKQTSDLLRGNAVHAAIEWAGLIKQGGEEEVTLEELLDVSDNFLADNGHTIDVWRHNYEDIVDVCRANLVAWYEEIFPILHPQAVEETFKKSMGIRHGVNLILQGTADWIDESGVIWDWKNPSRHYAAWEKKRWDIQSHAYTWAYDKEQFNLCVMADGKIQVIEIPRSPEQKKAFIELCWSIVPTLLTIDDAVTWPQNWEGWHCSPLWCPVWQANKCRGAILGDNPW
jgi:hypothetical protein|tara:strand:+ start:1225 stop:1998 length:774 start_codon:yes stop_codon:yes gene_type:complete